MIYVFLTRKNIQSPQNRLQRNLYFWPDELGFIFGFCTMKFTNRCHFQVMSFNPNHPNPETFGFGLFFFLGGFPFQWVPRPHRFPHHPLGGEGASAASPSTVASEEEACHLSGHLKRKLIQMVGFSQRLLYWWKWFKISLLDMGMTNKAFWTLKKASFLFSPQELEGFGSKYAVFTRWKGS